jgi:hypothetical protein
MARKRDAASPKTGDGRTKGAPIQGKNVVFRTSGGKATGSGESAVAKLIRLAAERLAGK